MVLRMPPTAAHQAQASIQLARERCRFVLVATSSERQPPDGIAGNWTGVDGRASVYLAFTISTQCPRPQIKPKQTSVLSGWTISVLSCATHCRLFPLCPLEDDDLLMMMSSDDLLRCRCGGQTRWRVQDCGCIPVYNHSHKCGHAQDDSAWPDVLQ